MTPFDLVPVRSVPSPDRSHLDHLPPRPPPGLILDRRTRQPLLSYGTRPAGPSRVADHAAAPWIAGRRQAEQIVHRQVAVTPPQALEERGGPDEAFEATAVAAPAHRAVLGDRRMADLAGRPDGSAVDLPAEDQ